MRKANGPNVMQRPMSEHELYRWRKVTKVVYQHGRFKRNAKKVSMHEYVCVYEFCVCAVCIRLFSFLSNSLCPSCAFVDFIFSMACWFHGARSFVAFRFYSLSFVPSFVDFPWNIFFFLLFFHCDFSIFRIHRGSVNFYFCWSIHSWVWVCVNALLDHQVKFPEFPAKSNTLCFLCIGMCLFLFIYNIYFAFFMYPSRYVKHIHALSHTHTHTQRARERVRERERRRAKLDENIYPSGITEKSYLRIQSAT